MLVGCAMRLSTPPSDSVQRETFQPGKECLYRGFPAHQLETQHGAEMLLLARCKRMVRMFGQARIENFCHRRMPALTRRPPLRRSRHAPACERANVRTPRNVMKLSNGAPVTPMAFAHQARF